MTGRAQRPAGIRYLWCAALLTPLAAIAAPESLEQAWARAIANDPALAAVVADAAAAAADERAARAARWPKLDTGATYTRYADAPALDVTTPTFSFQSPRVFDNDDTVMAFAQVTQPLYAGGSITAGIRAASEAARGATAEQARAVADLKLEVARNYIAVLRAERGLAAAEASAASLRSQVNDVQVMVETQSVAQSDLLAAKVSLANAEQQRLRAENGLRLAQVAYNRKVGAPAAEVPTLDQQLNGSVAASSSLVTEPVEALVERASVTRSEVTGLKAQSDALAARARAAWGRQLPQVALVGGYNHLETTILDREDFTSIGVGVKWNLFDGGEARNQAASLRRASQATSHRLDDLKNGIEYQVRAAWLGVREADARVTVTRTAVAESEENLRLSRELYGAGLANNTQVLEAVALRIAATNNTSDAELDAALARLELQRAVGEL